jgi:MYXO-CTERM domain-containing protein
MRVAACLLALACASITQGALIVSPGPPATPADYLEVELTWLPASPGYYQARAVGTSESAVQILSDQFWTPRIVDAMPQNIGKVEINFGPVFGQHTTLLTLPLQPDIDAGLAGIDVTIGAPDVNRVRQIDVTGAGGYVRSFTAVDVPEPAGALLLAAGMLALRRRRAS